MSLAFVIARDSYSCSIHGESRLYRLIRCSFCGSTASTCTRFYDLQLATMQLNNKHAHQLDTFQFHGCLVRCPKIDAAHTQCETCRFLQQTKRRKSEQRICSNRHPYTNGIECDATPVNLYYNSYEIWISWFLLLLNVSLVHRSCFVLTFNLSVVSFSRVVFMIMMMWLKCIKDRYCLIFSLFLSILCLILFLLLLKRCFSRYENYVRTSIVLIVQRVVLMSHTWNFIQHFT